MSLKDNGSNKKIFLTAEEDDEKRLDQFLAESTDLSRTFCQKLIKENQVYVGEKVITKPAYELKEDVTVEVLIPEPKNLEIAPEGISLDILYEDNDMIVVNKPAGMVVHPDNTYTSGTLVNALLGHFGPQNLSGIGGVRRPGIVHRLDKDTSGVIMVAKNNMAHRYLSEQIAERKVQKFYTALVFGKGKHETFSVDSPIARDPNNRKKMAISSAKHAREALTHIKLKEIYTDPLCILLDVQIITGRTHQIRVHLSSVGHPVVCDPLYGNEKQNTSFQKSFPLQRVFLHAKKLIMTLPNGEQKEYIAPLPKDLEATLKMLEY